MLIVGPLGINIGELLPGSISSMRKLKAAMKILAKNAVQKLETLKPFTILATSRIIMALITSRKNPSVRKVSGKVSMIRMGRRRALAKPSIRAEISNEVLLWNSNPLKMPLATQSDKLITPQ